MQPLLKVQRLSKTIRVRKGLFTRQPLCILHDVSFCLAQGQTLAIIGETGSGKSSLAKLLAGTYSASGGQIILDGKVIDDGTNRKKEGRQQDCRSIRLIFQEPTSSLNPAMTIGDTLSDCLRFNTELNSEQIEQKIKTTLATVGLLADHRFYYPHMFSGGQLQRVALARGLILDPKILVLDEALSSLDPSVRAQTVNLLLKLQKESNISFVLITHHLSLVKHISDQILVLDQGNVVEYGNTQEIFASPQSKITQRLLSCC